VSTHTETVVIRCAPVRAQRQLCIRELYVKTFRSERPVDTDAQRNVLTIVARLTAAVASRVLFS
jgi:hypothetical protein